MVQILPASKVTGFGQALGSFGTGALESLGEQIPKRMEERRLSQGLEALNRDSANMSPSEYLIRLESIPGVSPETKRQLGELKRQENIKSAYSRPLSGRKGNTPEQMEPRQQREDVRFGNFPEKQFAKSGMQQTRNVSPEEVGQPQINPNNPLREEALPVRPLTPEERDIEINRILESGKAATPEQAIAIQQDDERRRIEAAEVERKRDSYLNEKQLEAKNKFNEAYELKLQKLGPETFKDITGEMKERLMRGMEKDLRDNRSLSTTDAVSKWTTKALDLAKAKVQLNKLAGDSTTWALPVLLDKEGYKNKFEGYRQIYANAGNSEEFYNNLISKFGMTPQGAAFLTYKPSKQVESAIDKFKRQEVDFKSFAKGDYKNNLDRNAREIASKAAKSMTEDDSPLAIAYRLKKIDPQFDQNAYFGELLSMQDDLRLTERQKREISEGSQALGSNWADFLFLP